MKAGSGVLTEAIPDSAGIPADYAKYTLLAEYNNEESVKRIMETHGDDIACIVVEPVAANMGVVAPNPNFLQYLRNITKQYGALLIFDEVITGFRLALGGAQEFYGVVPDLTNKIYVAPSQFEAMFVSNAHDESIIEKTANIISDFKI